MSSLAELFATMGFQIDEKSIARYDKLVEDSTKKTEKATQVANDFASRLMKWSQDRAAAAEKERAVLKAADELLNRNKADAIDAQKAMATIGFGSLKADVADAEKKTRDWGKTVVALEAGYNLVNTAVGFVRGKIQGMLGDLKREGGAAGGLVSLSTRTGIATESLQELGYAASQNGSDLNAIAGGLKAFTNKADAAAAGSKSVAKTLREVGVSAKDLKSGKLSLDDALGKVADKFAKMPDGAKKTALAMDLFGGAGGALVPLLNQGSAGIAKLREEARKLGIVLTDDAIKGLAGFDDQSSKFQTSIDGLRKQALAAIVPALSKVIDKFQEWLGQNRERAVNALTGAFTILVKIISGVASAIETMMPLIGLVADNMDLVTGAVLGTIGALGAYRIAALVASAGSVAGALAAAAAWAVANAPFIAIGLAVAGLILLWPKIKAAAVTAGSAIKTAFLAVGATIKSALGFGLWNSIKAGFVKIGGGIKAAFSDAIDFVKGKLSDLKSWATGILKDIPLVGRFVGTGGPGGAAAGQPAPTAGGAFVPQAPSFVPSSAPASRTTTNNVTIPIAVTSNSADPKAVAQVVRSEFNTLWTGKLREVVS